MKLLGLITLVGVLTLEMDGTLEAGSSTPASAPEPPPQTGEAPPVQEPPPKKDDSSKPVTHEKEPPAQKAAEEGIIPKSIRIPGTDLALKIGGYAKVDFIQDFDAIGNAFDFQTNSIPMEGTDQAAESGRTTIHARETRVNFDLSSHGKEKFRVFVEGDFYGDGNAFRLRHAYGEFHGFLGGQTWSTFQDISARPLTIDFEGPDGEVFLRQAMIRYTRALTPNWHWAVAVESPTPQFAVPSGLPGVAKSNAPDFPAFVRYQAKRGHFQLAGMLRRIRFDGGQGVEDVTSTGFGVNATFALKTIGHDELLGMFVTGEGVARYIESLGGQNVDAVLSPDGELTTLRSRAFTIGYTRHWTKELKSGIAYSSSDVKSDPAQSGSAIDGTDDFRVNLIFSPYALVDVGSELLWGRRENVDGSEGEAWRVQFSVIYHFN
jgi:hypothetical protein